MKIICSFFILVVLTTDVFWRQFGETVSNDGSTDSPARREMHRGIGQARLDNARIVLRFGGADAMQGIVSGEINR